MTCVAQVTLFSSRDSQHVTLYSLYAQELGLVVALQRLLALAASVAPAEDEAQPDIREEITDLAAHLSKQVSFVFEPPPCHSSAQAGKLLKPMTNYSCTSVRTTMWMNGIYI